MTEAQALLALLLLGIASAVISKRYLGRDARLLVVGITLVSSVVTLADETS
jgi:hypothetical protein